MVLDAIGFVLVSGMFFALPGVLLIYAIWVAWMYGTDLQPPAELREAPTSLKPPRERPELKKAA